MRRSGRQKEWRGDETCHVGQDGILRAGWQPAPGGLPSRCHIAFSLVNHRTDCGADPLVCGRPPGRLFASGRHLILRVNSGSRGTRADLGVCPTNWCAGPGHEFYGI